MCRSRRSSRMSSMRIWSPTGSIRYTSGCEPRPTRPRSPINSPAKAIAAARLPTPGGPWKRYACAGPSSASAARSSRFASACSGKFSKTSTNLLVQLIRWPRAVEQDDSLTVLPGDYAVSVEHALPEVPSLPLDAVRAPSDTSRGGVEIDLEDEGDVREEASRRDPIQLVDLVDAQFARVALVGERRVDVPIRDHIVAGVECRGDHALDELGPGRREERSLRPRAHLHPFEEQAPHLLTERGAAGFPGGDDATSVSAERLGQKLRLRGLEIGRAS